MAHADLRKLRRSLLVWYDRNRRDLPWRVHGGGPPDPYRIWVAEVMLQQTRVDTVRSYYLRWIHRFPDLDTLAAASRDDVLKVWEGLGYYSRARNLHQAVNVVRERFEGKVPSDPAAFRSLPGVGRYTAGAVMSIAFGRHEPVVDGNVRRLFARLLDLPAPHDNDLWSLAARLVEGERPGDLNQALMEMGATICTPRSPMCGRCPIREDCRAFQAGTVDSRPAARAATQLPSEHEGVAVVECAGSYLLSRRPERARLGGLWEFPSSPCAGAADSERSARRAIVDRLGKVIRDITALQTVSHRFTHVRVIYHPYLGTLRSVSSERPQLAADLAWAEPSDFDRFAMPRAQHRIALLLRSHQ